MATEQPKLPTIDLQPKRRLTRKQSKFLDRYIRTGNGVRSAIAAYDTSDVPTANSIARANLQVPSIRQAVEDAWARQGITPDRWAGVLSDGMSASRRQLLGSGEDAQIVSEPDWQARLKSVELSARMVGAMETTRKVQSTAAHLHLLAGLAPEMLEQIASGTLIAKDLRREEFNVESDEVQGNLERDVT